MKYLGLFLMAVLSASAFAQPELNSNNIFYKLGDEYLVKQNDYIQMVTNIDPLLTGTNFTWDFSSPDAVFVSGNPVICVDPETTVFKDSVENVQICLKGADNNDGSYQYFFQDEDAVRLAGIGWSETGNTSYSRYSPPMKVFELPLNYGDSFNDEYVLLINHEAGAHYIDSAVVVNEADGYGTVKTPEATYSDVLRIKRTTTTRSYINAGGAWIFTTEMIVVDYFWYKPGIPVAVITISEGYDDSGYLVTYLSQWSSTVINSDGLQTDNIQVYPNPFANEFYIQNCDVGPEEIVICDISGKLIKTTDFRRFGNNLSLNPGAVPSGIYLVKIKTEDKLLIHKIIKQ